MRHLYFILFILTTSGCVSIPDKLSMDVDFQPSYSFPVTLKIIKNFDQGYLKFIVQDFQDRRKLIAFDSGSLTSSDFNFFFKLLDTISLLQIPYDTLQPPTDAILVDVKINQDGKTNRFINFSGNDEGFWLFKHALINLLNRKLPGQDYYIEDLERELGTNQSIKVKSKNPLVIKMYDRISSSQEDELKELFKKVPNDSRVIIDMTKFAIVDEILEPYFTSFDSSHANVIWVIQDDRRDHLAYIGIDTFKTVRSLEIAKKILVK